MTLLYEIKDKRIELERLEDRYKTETKPCSNNNCQFFDNKVIMGCTWSILVEDCSDYKVEQEEE